VFDLGDVEFAVMEANGEVNVLLKSDKLPLTAKAMRLALPPAAEPQTVILDGNVMDEALANLGLSRGWLHVELDKLGISPENVFVAQVNSMGDLYVDLFDDAIQLPQPSARAMLYGTLKKAQADLETFALQTNDANAKQMYAACAKELKEVINELEPILNT
jgi:hypothetical protein